MDRRRWKFYVFWGIIIFLFFLTLFFKKEYFVWENKLKEYINAIPPIYSWIIFIGLYVLGGVVIWYLKDILKLVGAIAYGVYISTLLIYISEIIDCIILFYFSRKMGKEYMEAQLKGKFKNLYQKLGNINFVILILLRAIILIPYRVLDISMGLTNISFKKYFLAVILGSLPRIFIVQFFVIVLRGVSFDMQAFRDYANSNPHIFLFSFIYTILVIILGFILGKKLK